MTRKSAAGVTVSVALLGVGDVRTSRTRALQKVHPVWSKRSKLQTYTVFCSYGHIRFFFCKLVIFSFLAP